VRDGGRERLEASFGASGPSGIGPAVGSGRLVDVQNRRSQPSPLLLFAYPGALPRGVAYIAREVKMEFGSLTDQRPTGSHPIQAFVGDLVLAPSPIAERRSSHWSWSARSGKRSRFSTLNFTGRPIGYAGPARATLRGCRRTVESRAGEGRAQPSRFTRTGADPQIALLSVKLGELRERHPRELGGWCHQTTGSRHCVQTTPPCSRCFLNAPCPSIGARDFA